MLEAKGYMGNSVLFDGQWVTIRRKGLSSLFLGGKEIRLHVSTIAQVRFKGSDLQKNGYIEFVGEERSDRKSRKKVRKQKVFDPKSAVYFLRKHQASFEELHAAVSQSTQTAKSGNSETTPASLPEQIEQLRSLLRQGALTQAQYEQAVSKLTTS